MGAPGSPIGGRQVCFRHKNARRPIEGTGIASPSRVCFGSRKSADFLPRAPRPGPRVRDARGVCSAYPWPMSRGPAMWATVVALALINVGLAATIVTLLGQTGFAPLSVSLAMIALGLVAAAGAVVLW